MAVHDSLLLYKAPRAKPQNYIKGHLLKTEQDFIVLAKEFGKLDQAEKTVQIFKPYHKGVEGQKKVPFKKFKEPIEQ